MQLLTCERHADVCDPERTRSQERRERLQLAFRVDDLPFVSSEALHSIGPQLVEHDVDRGVDAIQVVLVRNLERLRNEESVVDLELHVATVVQIEEDVAYLHVRRLREPLSGSREESEHHELLDGEETVMITHTGDTASGVIVLDAQHFERNNDLRAIHPLLSS